MSVLVTEVAAGAVAGGTCILYAAVGESFAESAGVVNLGVEGSMLVGALAAAVMFPLVFVPQLIFYGIVTVLRAALHAKGRFIAAALAPAVNNVIVMVACIAFRANRDGRVADLDLTTWQFALIAGGTTVGVLLTPRTDGVRPWDTTMMAVSGDLNLTSSDLARYRQLWASDGVDA